MVSRRNFLKNSAMAATTVTATSLAPKATRERGILNSIKTTLEEIREARANANGKLDKFLKEIDIFHADEIIKNFSDIITLNNLNENYLIEIQDTIRDLPLEAYEYIEYRGLIKKCEWVKAAKISLKACETIADQHSLNVIYPQIANKLGLSYRMMDEYEQAIHYYELALKYATRAEDKADILTNFCDIYRLSLNKEKALEFGEAALEYANDIPQKRAKALEYLGLLKHSYNELDASINYLNEAVNIRREINDPRLPLTLSFLAVSLIDRGSNKNLSLAIHYIQEIKETETDTGNRLANLYNLEGSAFLALKKYAKARDAFSLCFNTYRETNYDRGKVIAKSKILQAYIGIKELEEAAFTADYVLKKKDYLKPADFFALNLANSFFSLYQEIRAQTQTNLFEIIDEKIN